MEKGELFYPYRNFGALPQQFSSFENSSVVILPVPYDGTTEWQIGARRGPQAIIEASQNLELYDFELEREIYRVGICTLPEVEPLMTGPEPMIHRIYEVAKDLLSKRKFIVTLGGEHSITLGVVRAFVEKFEHLSVLQLDAHCDLRDEYLGTKYSYASVMRRIIELCPIVQVGIRSLSLEEHEFLKERGMETFYAQGLTLDQVFWDKLLSRLSPEVYVTVDLDVLDPSIMPAVTAPEPGGLNWQQILSILETVAREKKIMGFDLTELRPTEGTVGCSFLAAKLAYKLIGYVSYFQNSPFCRDNRPSSLEC